MRWHTFDRATFELGRSEIPVDDTHALGLYNAPRTIADAFRLRREVGPEVANEALRRWLRQGGQPSELMRYKLLSCRQARHPARAPVLL